jgi:general secretion pathway protein M
MRELADRDRWIALGILGAVLVLAYFLLVHWWWTSPMLDVGGRIAELQARDASARATLAQAPEVRRRLENVRAQSSRMPGFMTERTADLATAALVQRLETAVQEASPNNRSCEIQNRSPMTEQRQQRFPRAVVQVRLRCGMPELVTVLHILESGSPRLFVDNFNVIAARFYTPEANANNGGLDVNFELYGYLPPVQEAANAR